SGTGQASAPIRQLSLLQRPVLLVNSRLGLLSAAPCCSAREVRHSLGRSFSRSYGSNLPSSLTKVLPFASRYLPPPTSVGLRYGRNVNSAARIFLQVWAQPRRFDECLHFSRPLSLTWVRIYLHPDAYEPGTNHVQ